jgi:hypothetical protein
MHGLSNLVINYRSLKIIQLLNTLISRPYVNWLSLVVLTMQNPSWIINYRWRREVCKPKRVEVENNQPHCYHLTLNERHFQLLKQKLNFEFFKKIIIIFKSFNFTLGNWPIKMVHNKKKSFKELEGEMVHCTHI